MIFFYRKWLNRAKFILMFVIFTFMLYHLMAVVTEWVKPLDKYREPAGKSLKVFQHSGGIQESESIFERLRLFYWYGE